MRKSKIVRIAAIVTCIVVVLVTVVIVVLVTHKQSLPTNTYGCDQTTKQCKAQLGSMTQDECLSTCQTVDNTYGCNNSSHKCEQGLGNLTQQECLAKCPSVDNTYGFNKATSKCEQGFGNMSEDECTKSFLTFGCNIATGLCELGLGTQGPDCPCKKQTWKCDEDKWICKDTDVVTHTTQDDCQCDPHLTASPFEKVLQPNLANQEGINCNVGFTRDASGNLITTCSSSLCCASNYCGEYYSTDAYSTAACPSITNPKDCVVQPEGYACYYDKATSTCKPVSYDVGWCTTCTTDEQCKFAGKTGTCVNQVCQPAKVACFQQVTGIQPTTTPSNMPFGMDACFFLLDAQTIPPDTVCSQITSSYECAKTQYMSSCADKNNNVWYTKTTQCMIDES
jgi:hypothetical protein